MHKSRGVIPEQKIPDRKIDQTYKLYIHVLVPTPKKPYISYTTLSKIPITFFVVYLLLQIYTTFTTICHLLDNSIIIIQSLAIITQWHHAQISMPKT